MDPITNNTLQTKDIFTMARARFSDGKGQALTSTCLYRTPDGNNCVVGAMLTPHELNQLDNAGFNEVSLTTLDEMGYLPARLKPHIELLCALQDIHDGSYNWSNETKTLSIDGWRAVDELENEYLD